MVAVSQELCSGLGGDLPPALSQTAIKVSARAACEAGWTESLRSSLAVGWRHYFLTT